jgi:hypothetical protein
MPRKDVPSRFRQCGQNCFWRKASTRESRSYLFAEMFKTLLLWQKNETVSQTQYGKGCTRSQTKVLAELLWDRELALLTDLRSCQILENCLSACHELLIQFQKKHQCCSRESRLCLSVLSGTIILRPMTHIETSDYRISVSSLTN